MPHCYGLEPQTGSGHKRQSRGFNRGAAFHQRWMTEAQYHQHGLEAIWPLLAELAWLSPSHLNILMQRLKDAYLTRLRKTFDASYEGDGTVDDPHSQETPFIESTRPNPRHCRQSEDALSSIAAIIQWPAATSVTMRTSTSPAATIR
ncbi:hypothetical protein CS8_030190 [Cupriavidus sp. 8B]